MKSYAMYLQGLYEELLVTVSEYYPSLHRDCERDASRLLSLIERRGLSFLMIDLPVAGKHFDKCLAAGRLTRSYIPCQRAYRKGSVIPRLFKGMLMRVFDDSGMLRDDPDVACIRFLRQFYYMSKKAKVACDDSRTWEHVHEFFTIDREVRSPTLNWDGDELIDDDFRHLHIGDACSHLDALPLLDLLSDGQSGESPHATLARSDADVVQRTADIVFATIGGFDPAEWRARHGPGAVADQHHTQFKYDFPTWPAKLESVFPMALFGFANYDHWLEHSQGQDAFELFTAHEPPSRLIAVPKTLKGPRLIACEPVSHQWCQQIILDFLTSSLAKTPIKSSIHFRDQTRNQEAARRASHTQSHMTIDLSSASDRLSCWLVERIFRVNPSLLKALHASRTRWVVNTIDSKSPRYSRIRKFACMGSACTFPVQSYVFAVLAVASVLIARKTRPTIASIRKASSEVLVFGDDIVVPTDGGVVLQGLLGNLGLKVNRDKTFGIGKFRESCGLDAYDGHDVTPTYTITYPDVSRPESIVSVVETHNNLIRRGWYRLADYTKSTVHALRRFRVAHVPMGSGAFGWLDPFGVGNSHLNRRYNPRLQRVEYHADSLQQRSRRVPVERGSAVLQYFTEAQCPTYIVGDRIGIPGRSSTSIRRRWVSELQINT